MNVKIYVDSSQIEFLSAKLDSLGISEISKIKKIENTTRSVFQDPVVVSAIIAASGAVVVKILDIIYNLVKKGSNKKYDVIIIQSDTRSLELNIDDIPADEEDRIDEFNKLDISGETISYKIK